MTEHCDMCGTSLPATMGYLCVDGPMSGHLVFLATAYHTVRIEGIHGPLEGAYRKTQVDAHRWEFLWVKDVPAYEPHLIDRKALKAEIFDLPIGKSVEYGRGYSAAILAFHRVIDDQS